MIMSLHLDPPNRNIPKNDVVFVGVQSLTHVGIKGVRPTSERSSLAAAQAAKRPIGIWARSGVFLFNYSSHIYKGIQNTSYPGGTG
jgi:hypothetical protein